MESRDRAVVFGCLVPGELRLLLHPGVGLADGKIPVDVPIELVPADCRMPNTPLWVTTRGGVVVSADRR